ncbi:MAG TPA: geranylgeranylglyceryl/heptaprenylglyceryl phosphate synthase [Bacteroidia bacterium]|nr:geranylgeranylglyceryl/heptaprenylglyceryl phosphate synthase [Bacteroidia bacterium]
MANPVLNLIRNASSAGRKLVALLVDPDSFKSDQTSEMIAGSGADLVFVGGSLISGGNMEATISELKARISIPIVIFPGNLLQICSAADAILNLSLISGRNPEFLIGQHVVAAPQLKSSGLEIIPTGYMLIDSGKQTTASYISSTTPIPHDKPDIAVCTALAGEMLGLQLIYMDGGSGARDTISEKMISLVKKNLSVPLIIGGGIRSVEQANKLLRAGADLLVIGNILQEEPELAGQIVRAVHSIHMQL